MSFLEVTTESNNLIEILRFGLCLHVQSVSLLTELSDIGISRFLDSKGCYIYV